MTVQTGTGATVSIGTTASATTQAQFDADTYAAIGEVETIGAFGDSKAEVRFTSLSDGRVRKYRGAADAGTMSIRVAMDPGDAGQSAVQAAFAITSQAADEFNFKIEFNDSLGTNGTTRYFRGKVMGNPNQGAENDAIVMEEVSIAINSPIVRKAAA